MITKYRRRPGHLLGGLGVALGSLGFAVLLYLTGVWMFTEQAIGTRPLLALGVLLVVVAIQLFSFGIIAELIVHRSELRDSPSLVVDRAGDG
jgi:hypothetical protein